MTTEYFVGIDGVLDLSILREKILKKGQKWLYPSINKSLSVLDYDSSHKGNYSKREKGKRGFKEDDIDGIVSDNIINALEKDDYYSSLSKDDALTKVENLRDEFFKLGGEEDVPDKRVLSNTISKIQAIGNAIKRSEDLQQCRRMLYVAIQIALSYFMHNGSDNKASGWDEISSLMGQQTVEQAERYSIIPVLNRLYCSDIHNFRMQKNYYVTITRAFLFALIEYVFKETNLEPLRDLLIKSDFSSGDMDLVREFCRQRGSAATLVHYQEWYALSQWLEMEITQRGKYVNIGIGVNNAGVADAAATIRLCVELLEYLPKSFIANSPKVIESVCYTVSDYLFALSTSGYFRNEEDAVREARRSQLVQCVDLLLENRCPSYCFIFALIEKDEFGSNLVDLDVKYVHGTILNYYSYLPLEEGKFSIARQYLEWCERNQTSYPKRLIFDFVCFDLPLWENYAKRDIKTAANALYNHVFKYFEKVPTDGSVIDALPEIENNKVLIYNTQKLFLPFPKGSASYSICLPAFFISSKKGLFFDGYYESVGKTVVYLLYQPNSFKHAWGFFSFIQFILCRITENEPLYGFEAFRRFNDWNALCSENASPEMVGSLKKRYMDLYDPGGSDEKNRYYKARTPKTIKQRIELVDNVKTIDKKKNLTLKLLGQINWEWPELSSEDRERCLRFAKRELKNGDSKTIALSLSILDQEEDTKQIRLEKLKSLVSFGQPKQGLSIYHIESLLSSSVVGYLYRNWNSSHDDPWQLNLFKMLFTDKNMKLFSKSCEDFPEVYDLTTLLCKQNRDLPEDLLISLIYAVRNHSELLELIDFSRLSFEDPYNPGSIKPTWISFSLWRFYHEVEGGRQIQLGTLSIQDINRIIIKECFVNLLTSNSSVKYEFNMNWDNVTYHIISDLKEHPELTAGISAFLAYKLMGLVDNRIKEQRSDITKFLTSISDICPVIFRHPCLYNLMTDVMKRVQAKLVLNKQQDLFHDLLSDIRDQLQSDQRNWFETGIISERNDNLEDLVVNVFDIWVAEDEPKDDPEFSQLLMDYYMAGDYGKPFCPSAPVIVTEFEERLYAIEKRSVIRRVRDFANQMNIQIPIQVKKLVPGTICYAENE